MTKLESYMIEGNFAATQFYADVEGHPRITILRSHSRNSRFSTEMKILGVLSRASFRATFSAPTN